MEHPQAQAQAPGIQFPSIQMPPTEPMKEEELHTDPHTRPAPNVVDLNPHTLPVADQLLRIHVIRAHFTEIHEHQDLEAYVVVTVGKKSAKSHTHPIMRSKDPKEPRTCTWDEHFTIEHEFRDNDSHVVIEVFDAFTKESLGFYKEKVNKIDPPKKGADPQTEVAKNNKADKESREDWASAIVKEVPLNHKQDDHHPGSLTLRIRRELKMIGILDVKLKGVGLENIAHSSEIKGVKCVLKLLDQVHESPCSRGKSGSITSDFTWDSFRTSFKVNETNHVFDMFIEIWTDEIVEAGETSTPIKPSLLGEARLPLFDAQTKFSHPLPIISPLHKQVGELKLIAKMKDIQRRTADVQ